MKGLVNRILLRILTPPLSAEGNARGNLSVLTDRYDAARLKRHVELFSSQMREYFTRIWVSERARIRSAP